MDDINVPENNPLHDLHNFATTQFIQEIRAEICQKLRWSVPTYYRQLRTALNNEQIAKIVPIIRARVVLFLISLNKYKQ